MLDAAASNTLTIATDRDIALKAPQGTITLDAQKIEVKASGSASVQASGDLTLKGATVNINERARAEETGDGGSQPPSKGIG